MEYFCFMELTNKQLRFCEEYVVDLNATEAAIRSGYSKKTAKQIGSENLSKLAIKDKIEELMLQKRVSSQLTEELIVDELKSLGFYSIKTFINRDNTIATLSDLTTEQLRPVVGIKIKETYTTIGDVTTKDVTTELKLADKRGALVDLGRHIGIFDKDNKQKAIKIKVTRK
jgi:phage terminase small subunit